MAVSSETDLLDTSPIVLRDEDGQAFAFRPLRALRDGTDVFILAEREGPGTLHVLAREGGFVGLVRDPATLGRVALRLEILRRAMEGELIEWTEEGEEHFLGVFHRGEVQGRPYLLAADLADPATVVAFEPGPDGLRPADGDRVALIHEQLAAALADWDAARPNLEAAVLGLRRERIQVTDASGRAHEYEGAGRLFFQGRDLLFLAPRDEPRHAVAFAVQGGGRIEPIADERFLAELRAHLDGLAHATRRPS